MDFHGLTGQVRFKEGRRANITLDLLKLRRENLIKVGHWNSQNGLNISDPHVYYDGNTPNVTLIVMTKEVRHQLSNRQNIIGISFWLTL